MIAHLAGPSSQPSTTPSVLPPVTVPAPPSAAAHARDCTTVLQKLPIRLAGLEQRVVHPTPDSPYVVAWGEPPVVWKCGVPRPAELRAGSSAQAVAVDGVWFLPVARSDDTVWTAVDRAVYVAGTVPKRYAQPPLAPVAAAIGALPQVCVLDPRQPVDRQCTRRP